jgi:phospholipase C
MTPEERLAQVKHIVVLMMENRSFDHMLGYLKRDGKPDVRGLEGDERNLDPEGNAIGVHPLDTHAAAEQRRVREALQEALDPSHSEESVETQIGTGMDGFVANYVATRKTAPGEFPRALWGVPMGYYTKEALPTYDYFARGYCVCDAWHSSVPGDTWPNRQYALAGRKSDNVWDRSNLLKILTRKRSPLARLRNVPLYDVAAFTRWLGPDQWRWYSHDPATLRGADPEYRNMKDLKRGNFTWFDRRQMHARTTLLEEDLLGIVADDSFLDDVASGTEGFRTISWIDPNFVDLNVLDPNSNDDHPPSDILAGQHLAFEVYDALRKSPEWDDTVLVITYDEHGGFYDHVPPPPVQDSSEYDKLGVRVPTLIVGPRVKKGYVAHEAFADAPEEPGGVEAWDHTALIRSILMVCLGDGAERAISDMGGRVSDRRAHLGLVLEDEPNRELPEDARDPAPQLRNWLVTAREKRRPAEGGRPSEEPDGAGHPLVLTEFQRQFVGYALVMREAGLPRVLVEGPPGVAWYRGVLTRMFAPLRRAYLALARPRTRA